MLHIFGHNTDYACDFVWCFVHAFQQLLCMTCWRPSFWYNVVKWTHTPRYGYLQSLDWTSRLDWWTDIKKHSYGF